MPPTGQIVGMPTGMPMVDTIVQVPTNEPTAHAIENQDTRHITREFDMLTANVWHLYRGV